MKLRQDLLNIVKAARSLPPDEVSDEDTVNVILGEIRDALLTDEVTNEANRGITAYVNDTWNNDQPVHMKMIHATRTGIAAALDAADIVRHPQGDDMSGYTHADYALGTDNKP